VILDAGDRNRHPTLPPWKKETTNLQLETEVQLDEEASEEATSTFLKPSLAATGTPKSSMYT
jgi:hypothetical protein